MRARLQNPQLITVEAVSRASTVYDDLADEPAGAIARSSSFTILAQVDIDTANRRSPGQGGPTVMKRIDLTLDLVDVEAAGWEPADGDRVTRVCRDRHGNGPRTVNWRMVDPHASGVIGPEGLVIVACEEAGKQRLQTEGV